MATNTVKRLKALHDEIGAPTFEKIPDLRKKYYEVPKIAHLFQEVHHLFECLTAHVHQYDQFQKDIVHPFTRIGATRNAIRLEKLLDHQTRMVLLDFIPVYFIHYSADHPEYWKILKGEFVDELFKNGKASSELETLVARLITWIYGTAKKQEDDKCLEKLKNIAWKG